MEHMELRAMDLAEVRNLVKWIDEQQRKSRQELAALQQQFVNQGKEMSSVVKRVKELESQYSTTQAQIARLSQIDDQMDQLRTEIIHLIEQADDRRVKSEKEMERLRQVEYDTQTRTLAEIKETLSSVPRLLEEMEQRRAEDERLSALIGTLSNQIPDIEARLDERVRDVTFLEEAQRQESRRIAEVHQEAIELQKRTDSLQAKNLVLEDALRRDAARLEQLQQSEAERQQTLENYLEQGRLADQRRKAELAGWAEQVEEFEELMAGYAKQWRLFEEQHRLSKESTTGLQELKQRLEKRQNEMSELQRVETERMRQQWTEFLGEVDRRHKQQEVERDQWSKEQQRQREDYREQFRVMQEQLDKASADIKALFELQLKYADAFRQMTRIWLEGYESVVATPITRRVPG
jgi:chromosome segregation ATPase